MKLEIAGISQTAQHIFCTMTKKKISAGEYPTCSQLLICDALVYDPNSSKPNLFGVRDNLTPSALPGDVTFCVYVKLYGGKGKKPINVSLVDPKGNAVKGASMDVDDFTGRPEQLATMGLTFNAELSVKGPHKVVVRSGRRILGESSPIKVVTRSQKK